MSLSELQLEITYRSDTNNVVTDFYVPCMMRARLYRRAVGYFTSNGLAFAGKGVAHLLKNDGRIQLIASPQLSDEDLRAIAQGYESQGEVIKRAAALSFKDVESSIVKDRLNALAWLISTGALDIKLAIKTNDDGNILRGIYHEKIGIFTDQFDNHIAFAGSANETIGGLIDNFEAIEVYWSWDDVQGRVKRKLTDYGRLWDNGTQGIEVIEFTDVSREILERFRTKAQPSSDPEERPLRLHPPVKPYGEPVIPLSLDVRDYQLKAGDNWFLNNGRGMLKMATGTGKTVTALSIVSRLYEKIGLQAVIILCPFRHLVTQWERECRRFGISPILAFESRTRWIDRLTTALSGLSTEALPFLCVITTYRTFSGPTFQSKLKYLPRKTLLIGDEVHNLGAAKLLRTLPENVVFRLGLSATPERWLDEPGTDALFEYFGPVLDPQLTLKDALEKGVLVPYRYFPVVVELTDSEREEYLRLSAKIAQAYAATSVNGETLDFNDNPTLQELLRRRARLVAVASNKLGALREVMGAKSSDSHMLVYCGDGTVEDEVDAAVMRHVEAVSRILGYELNIKVSTYTAETSLEEREDLRQRFDKGELQGLVAIRCLDEGVDIPSIRTAVILASSSNPRQFIQRRGRILRRHPDKQEAEIYDMFVVPPDEAVKSEAERKLVRKELLRFVEFADLAINSGEARGKILKIQRDYGLLDI